MPCAVGGRWRSDKTAQLFSLLTKEKKNGEREKKTKDFLCQRKTNSTHAILGLFKYFNPTLVVSHFTFYIWSRTVCL